MKRKAIYKIIWKSVLCGFLYELLYQIALALRWMTKAEGNSFIAAAFAGVIIALIIKQDKAIHTVITTISSLALAFIFNLIAIRLSIKQGVLMGEFTELNDKQFNGYDKRKRRYYILSVERANKMGEGTLFAKIDK